MFSAASENIVEVDLHVYQRPAQRALRPASVLEVVIDLSPGADSQESSEGTEPAEIGALSTFAVDEDLLVVRHERLEDLLRRLDGFPLLGGQVEVGRGRRGNRCRWWGRFWEVHFFLAAGGEHTGGESHRDRRGGARQRLVRHHLCPPGLVPLLVPASGWSGLRRGPYALAAHPREFTGSELTRTGPEWSLWIRVEPVENSNQPQYGQLSI